MAKGARIPASPEYRRKCAREAAARRRELQRWLRDPIAQAEHAGAVERHQEMCRLARLNRAREEPRRIAQHIREYLGDLRAMKSRGPAEAMLVNIRVSFREAWRLRRNAQAEWRQLDAGP